METHSTSSLPGSAQCRNYKPELMTYVRLGRTGLTVSRVSLGGYANHRQKANAHTTARAHSRPAPGRWRF